MSAPADTECQSIDLETSEPASEAASRAASLTHRVDEPRRLLDDGESQTVLLLNGGFMTAVSWDPIAEPLLEHRRVVRCDFRGQLMTPGPAHARLEDNVADVVALLDHLRAEHGLDGVDDPVHVLGTSYGGKVGLHLAARHPERVASLTVVTAADHAHDTLFRDADELRAIVASILDGGDRTAFHDLLVRTVYSAEHAAAHADTLAERGRLVAGLPDAWFASAVDLVASLRGYDARPELAAIRCPTLVVVAGDDQVTLPEPGRAIARGIRHAKLVEHPTSGHALVAEEPEWLVDVVTGWLDELRDATA